MSPINLFDYTNVRKKIPARVLKHKTPEPKSISSYQIIAAHMLDALTVIGLTTAIAAVVGISASTFMVTSNLHAAFNKIPFTNFVISLMPLIFSSYFFFSYFFNHGQSYGMKVLKTRIEMPEMSYRSSLFWGIFSAAAVMSGGLTLLSYQWIQKKGWGEFKGHDYLYFELVSEKTYSPVNLVEMTAALNHKPKLQEEEETFLQAA